MSYTEQKLRDKLIRMTSRAESIQTISQWVMFHRKHVDDMAKVWEEEFYKAEPSQQLNFLYLVNDIMQGSRRKYGQVLIEAFSKYIVSTMKLALKNSESDMRQKAKRLVGIWRDRDILGEMVVNELTAVVEGRGGEGEGGSGTPRRSSPSTKGGALMIDASGGDGLMSTPSPSSFTMINSPRPQDAVETAPFKEIVDILMTLIAEAKYR